MIERFGRGRRAERVRPDLETEFPRVPPHHAINAVRGDHLVGRMVAAVVERAEEGLASALL